MLSTATEKKIEAPESKTATTKKAKKYIEHGDLDVNFVKAYSKSGVDIINGFESQFYHVRRPDSIRFRAITKKNIQKKLEEKLGNHYTLPRDYSRDSGKLEVDAKRAVEFLNILASLKERYKTKFIIGKTQFNELLSDLVKNNYLTETQKNHYAQTIATDLTFEERETLAKEKKDFNEAIAIAKIYQEKLVSKLYSQESALLWLRRAIEFHPPNGLEELQKHIDLKEFLKTFTTLYNASFLFDQDKSDALLPILKNIIVTLDFGTFFHPDLVNFSLGEFIENNKTLKSLDISTTWSQDSHMCLKSKQMFYIAQGLISNDCLEELDISDQPIGDSGLLFLLDALNRNPNTKLRKLNLFSTGMTAKGQKALEEFLKSNKTLEWVNVGSNHGVSTELIDILTGINKHTRELQEKDVEAKPMEIEAPRLTMEEPSPEVITSDMTEEEELQFIADFIETPNPDSNASKQGVDLVNKWLIKRPDAVMDIIKNHPMIAATYLLSDLASKMSRQGSFNKLDILYEKCADDVLDAAIYNDYDLERCLNVFPTRSKDIIKDLCASEKYFKRLLECDKNPYDTLNHIIEKHSHYKDQFIHAYRTHYKILPENPAELLILMRTLFQEDNLPAMKDLIKKLKADNHNYLKYDHREMVASIMRDAILANKKDWLFYFIFDEKISANIKAYTTNNLDSDEKELIYFAIKSKNTPIAKLLSRHTHPKSTAGMEAALEFKDAEIAEYMLKHEDAKANDTVELNYSDKETYLSLAASHLDYPMAKVLIAYNADVEDALYLHNKNFRGGGFFMSAKSHTLSERESHQKSVQFLLDHAMGLNLHSKKTYSHGFHNLNFLEDIDIAGFNFIGVSFDGKPITKDMLLEKKLINADKAIFSLKDLEEMTDLSRKEIIQKNLDAAFQKYGKVVDEKTGIVNLAPLGEAVTTGDIKAVEARLRAGASPNMTYNFTHTYSLSGKPDDVSLINIAIACGHTDIVKLLVENRKFDEKYLPHAIILARQLGQKDIAEYLSEQQDDVNQQNHHGNTMLHLAAAFEDVARLKECIEQEMDVDITNNDGKTALGILAGRHADRHGYIWHSRETTLSANDVEMIRLLIEAKADANIGERVTALNLAALSGSYEAMKLLLPVTLKKDRIYKIYVNDKEIEKAFPWYVPLMFDSFGSAHWLEILTMLKKEGADLNHRNEEGMSLLQLLLSHINLTHREKRLSIYAEQLQFLFDNGANPSEKYKKGETALDIQKALQVAIEKSKNKEESEKSVPLSTSRDALFSAKEKTEASPMDDEEEESYKCRVM